MMQRKNRVKHYEKVEKKTYWTFEKTLKKKHTKTQIMKSYDVLKTQKKVNAKPC